MNTMPEAESLPLLSDVEKRPIGRVSRPLQREHPRSLKRSVVSCATKSEPGADILDVLCPAESTNKTVIDHVLKGIPW